MTTSGSHAATTPATEPTEPTVGELVAAVGRDVSELVRDEITLAKLELADSVKTAGKGAGMLGGAGFLGFFAFLLLSFAAVYGLVTLGLNTALSFLIVAVVYLVVAGILGLLGKNALQKAAPPERTVRTVKELPQAFKH